MPMLDRVRGIEPHGGNLVNRLIASSDVQAKRDEAKGYPEISITSRHYSDLEMIAIGGFSPLEGFLSKADYESVVSKMRLANGLLWPIPIALDVDQKTKAKLKTGQPAALVFEKQTVAVLHVEDIFEFDKKKEARFVYKTEEEKHPGVAAVYAKKDFLVGGKVEVFKTRDYSDFPQYNLTPEDTRRAFEEKGWKEVVGFQTRNPINRAHEYLTKTALEIVDGLLIQPIVGDTKKDDIPAKVRMKCYEVLIDNYYPKPRVLLSINPSNMYYAGPREAVLHALVRQNYGCTHFIVGRDHAGVDGYYGTYDAQELLKSFSRDEIKVQPLCFENSFYCKKTKGMATEKTTNSSKEERVFLSGTEVRKMLAKGQIPPEEFTRPEVAKILMDSMK